MNALVKALDKLHIVRPENSSYCGLKVQPVDLGQQAPGRIQLAIDERRIKDQLGPLIGDLRLPPVFNLALHGFEVPLDPVYSDRKGVNQIEALAVLGQDRSEHAGDNVSKFP